MTDRVNSEPPIFNGMSETEASYLGAAGFMASACVGGLVVSFTGHFLIMMVICIIGTLLTLWYGSLYLQKIKRGKPEGCYVQAARIYLSQRGFMKKRYLAHDGYFDLGRRLEP
nr:TIGR03750 family conjugal transfer protein [Delftia sp. PS-11]